MSTEIDNGSGAAVGVDNPFEDADSLEDAAEIAGFNVNAPDNIEGYEGTSIQAIPNDLIQIVYGDTDHNICVRKSSYDGDVSGDYNEYPSVEEEEIRGRNVRMKSKDSKIHVVTWSDGEYNYSIQSNDGLSHTVAEKILEAVE